MVILMPFSTWSYNRSLPQKGHGSSREYDGRMSGKTMFCKYGTTIFENFKRPFRSFIPRSHRNCSAGLRCWSCLPDERHPGDLVLVTHWCLVASKSLRQGKHGNINDCRKIRANLWWSFRKVVPIVSETVWFLFMRCKHHSVDFPLSSHGLLSY